MDCWPAWRNSMAMSCQCMTDTGMYGSLQVYFYKQPYILSTWCFSWVSGAEVFANIRTVFSLFTEYCFLVILRTRPWYTNWELKLTIGASRVLVAVMPLSRCCMSSEGAPTPAGTCENFFAHTYKIAMGHAWLKWEGHLLVKWVGGL